MDSTTCKPNQPGVIIVEGRQTAGNLLLAAKESPRLPQTAMRAGRAENAASKSAGEVGWPGKAARPATSRLGAQAAAADAEAFNFDHLAGLDVAAVHEEIARAETTPTSNLAAAMIAASGQRHTPHARTADRNVSSLAAAMIAAAGSHGGGK